MKPIQLVITIALVGAGLLLYDTLRGGPTPPGTTVQVGALDRPASAGTEPGAHEPAAGNGALSGVGAEAILDRMAAVEQRLTGLENAIREGRGRPHEGPTNEEGGSGFRRPEEFPETALREGEDPRFSEDEVRWFRALSEEVLRRRRKEAEITAIQSQLDRIRPGLMSDVRDELVETTRLYREEKRTVLGQAAKESWSLEKRQAALQKAQTEYEAEVRRLLPRDAEDVLQRFGAFPGSRMDRPFRRDR